MLIILSYLSLISTEILNAKIQDVGAYMELLQQQQEHMQELHLPGCCQHQNEWYQKNMQICPNYFKYTCICILLQWQV